MGKSFGEIVDISAGGVRIRAAHNADVKADGQIRIRLELPDYAGISPFIDNTGANLEPKREWIGWMAVARVQQDGNQMDIAGRLIDARSNAAQRRAGFTPGPFRFPST